MYLQYFDVYRLWWCQNWFIYSWIEKDLIACIRTYQRCYQPLQKSTMQFFGKIVSNANLNTLTILTKSSIWDGWLGTECFSAGEYNTAFKIQAEIFLWQQVKIESFWSLGQLIV